MGIENVRALIECDFCAARFHIDIDRTEFGDVDDIVEAAVSSGEIIEGRESSSMQFKMMLCGECTDFLDTARQEARAGGGDDLGADDAKEALERAWTKKRLAIPTNEPR